MNRLRLHWPVLTAITAMLFALLTLGAPRALAQNVSSGTVVGTVTDPSGAVIQGAAITMTDLSTKVERKTVSNKDGAYVLVDVPPGNYQVTAEKSGFQIDQILSLMVSVGTQATANFKMVVGAETQTVSVEASNVFLQTMNASTGQTVDPVVVNSLPAVNRDVSTFAALQPGVTPGGNVAGAAADQGTYQLDGGSNTSDMDATGNVYFSSLAGSTTGGFIGAGTAGVVPMPQDSVEEFKVATTGQSADFNNSSGSQVQVVTKRGHDKWHGTLYEYYLDSNIGANTWQNNFPNAVSSTYPASPATGLLLGSTSYTPKPSYHFNRFGAAAGGPIAPKFLGGKTYFFANYEGFRYPLAATYERTVPSYQYLQQGQLTFSGNLAGCTYNSATKTSTCSPQQLKTADPRGLGLDPALFSYYNTQLPVAPASNNGNVGNTGTTYAGVFDSSCGALSTSYCDGTNLIGYKANLLTPQRSDFLATRVDHDFGDKWHLMASYRYFALANLTSNQVDIGGKLTSAPVGTPVATAPRPQQPWYGVIGMTTNITSAVTNDFHYSYTRNYWQYRSGGAPPQFAGAVGAIEPLGESSNTTVLSPYNLNTQNIRTRIWDGKDNFFRDDVSWLKGNHFLQFGGQFQHNFNYHNRSDNGASINFTPTYQIGDSGGGGLITYSTLKNVGASSTSAARQLDTYYGLVTDTQVANTYTNNSGTLNLNAPNTYIYARTSIPYYNIYASDTWHAMPNVSINYGLGYALEMPPTERNGNQVMFTDASGNPIYINQWLAQRQSAAASGTVFNPEIGFALIHNVAGGRKYVYDPYYKALSPRISVAITPKAEGLLGKVFGDGTTVIRAGYGRIYGRVNGDVQVLNPLLSPGLILATSCTSVTTANLCSATQTTDATNFRYNTDGLSPTLAAAAAPATLPQPYHPGFDGPGVQIASPVDPSVRPSDVDTINFSVQRQVNRKMIVEAGYIGRIIHKDYIMLNPNQVPYNLALGGQSFASAYVAIEQAFGCTTSQSLCSAANTAASAKTYPTVAAQPFFEAALGGANSAYCTGYANCTTAVVQKQASNFATQSIFNLWKALDNNNNGTGATPGFTFARSLMGTPVVGTAGAQAGTAGQILRGMTVGTSDGYANYNAGYVSFKASGFHGLTAVSNFTWGKAMGLGTYNQSTSSITAANNYNLNEQYGRQGFDQKFIFNTFLVYDTPWYRNQAGIIGRLVGGWELSPVLSAGTGQPLQCTTNNSGQNFGGEDGSTITDNESCIFTTPYTGSYSTKRGVYGSTDPNNSVQNIGTNVHAGASSAAVNMFSNPAAVYDTTRPPILGLDSRGGSYTGISGLGYLNLDLSVNKTLKVWEKTSMVFYGQFYNVMNHMEFASPSLSYQSATSWGVTKSQGNSPRQIQMGIRANF